MIAEWLRWLWFVILHVFNRVMARNKSLENDKFFWVKEKSGHFNFSQESLAKNIRSQKKKSGNLRISKSNHHC